MRYVRVGIEVAAALTGGRMSDFILHPSYRHEDRTVLVHRSLIEGRG